jgi:hypothetical protein
MRQSLGFLILFPMILSGCCTTQVTKPECPVSIMAKIPDEPKPNNEAQMNEAAVQWFVGDYQPKFQSMQTRLKSAQDWCAKKEN